MNKVISDIGFDLLTSGELHLHRRLPRAVGDENAPQEAGASSEEEEGWVGSGGFFGGRIGSCWHYPAEDPVQDPAQGPHIKYNLFLFF